MNNLLYIICFSFGALTFLMFLCSVCATVFANSFLQSPNRDNVIKWNTRFSFMKTVCWQLTIYIFAALSFLKLLVDVGIFV